MDPWILNLWPALQKQLHVKWRHINGPSLNSDFIGMNESLKNYSNIAIMESGSKEADSISDLPRFLEGFDISKCRVPKLPTPALEILFNEDSVRIYIFCVCVLKNV